MIYKLKVNDNDTYYKYKGWNEDGIPTRDSLHELGLDYVSKDFIKREILTDNGDTPSTGSPDEKEQE